MSFAMPENKLCWEVNPELWETFHNVFKSVNNVRPCGDWTEEEVVQWLDTYQDENNKHFVVIDEQAYIDYRESVADYYSSLEFDDGA